MAYYHNNKDGTRSRIASNQTFQDTPTETLVTRAELPTTILVPETTVQGVFDSEYYPQHVVTTVKSDGSVDVAL